MKNQIVGISLFLLFLNFYLFTNDTSFNGYRMLLQIHMNESSILELDTTKIKEVRERSTLESTNLSFVLTGNVRRSNMKLVLGIPTAKRDYESYLMTTLTSIFENISEKEKCLIIVFVANFDPSYIKSIFKQLQENFNSEIASGLLEAVSPSKVNYPPDLIKSNGAIRNQWFAKQNIDYANVMTYAQNRGLYYMQLEDDVLAKPKFVDHILQFAKRRGDAWFALDFNQMGFIGVLFHTKDLPRLAQVFIKSCRKQPVDLLLNSERGKIKNQSFRYNIHLFRHIGARSTLKGKIHDLNTHAITVMKTTGNPPATLHSNIKQVGEHGIDSTYDGNGYFLGENPKVGHFIRIHFKSGQKLGAFKIVSGNDQYHREIIIGGKIEMKLINGGRLIYLGSFGNNGTAEGVIREKRLIAEIYITFTQDSNTNIVLSEITFEPAMDCKTMECVNVYKGRKD